MRRPSFHEISQWSLQFIRISIYYSKERWRRQVQNSDRINLGEEVFSLEIDELARTRQKLRPLIDVIFFKKLFL